MLLISWLRDVRARAQNSVRRSPGPRRRCRPIGVAASVVIAEVQQLEARELLSGVLADVTPITTPVALEGTSTGNVVLATFTDATSPAGGFTTLNPPGAYQGKATPTGVSGNNVVGVYWDASNIRHGFLYNGSTYTTLTPPGTAVEGSGYQLGTTSAAGVSGNNVVGWYIDANSQTHAYLYNGSTYTTLDPPGATSSLAVAVSGNNVVGVFTVAGGVTTGFLYNGSTYTTLTMPGGATTTPAAISGNDVVGSYTAGDNHGFLFDGTNYTTLDVPGGFHTTPTGVSGSIVVGEYYSGGSYHRFSYDGSTYNTNIDPPFGQAYYYPGETGTTVNDGSNIVGSFTAVLGANQGYLFNGSTYVVIDFPGANYTNLTGISGNKIVGEYYGASTGNLIAGFVYQVPPVAASFTPVVNWGGTLVGTPTVSVQLVSQSSTSSTWEVIGNATYATAGKHQVTVTVNDNAGNSVQTSNATIAVSALDGVYAVTSPGNPASLATISQSGATLTLNGTSTTTASFTSPTTLVVGTSDSATYANDTITFGSTGTFANRVWTKLDLPPDYTNQQGAATHVIQNGTAITFVDKFGGTSPGVWISPSQLSATAWGETVTTGLGKLVWSDGSIWSENLSLQGANNGNGTATITSAPSQVSVFDYVNGSGKAVHLVQTGTTNIVVIDGTGHMSIGAYLNATQFSTPYFANDVATISNDFSTITWTDGGVWRLTAPTSAITVTNYTNQNGVPVHLVQNGTSQLAFVDGLGRTSLGTMLSATTAQADLYVGDIATFSGNTVTWQDGFVWTQTNNLPLMTTFTDANGVVSHVKLTSATTLVGLDGPLKGLTGTRQDNGQILWATTQSPLLGATDYFNVNNGGFTHVIQNGTNSFVFINEFGATVLGTVTSPAGSSPVQVTVPAWNNDVATFGTGQITWSDGSTWTQTSSAAPQLVVSDYINLGNGQTAHAIFTTTNTVIFVNEAGVFALGTRTNATQATVPAWGNDVATFSTGQIHWSDGSLWTMGTAYTYLWNNFDLSAFNALFEMGSGYP